MSSISSFFARLAVAVLTVVPGMLVRGQNPSGSPPSLREFMRSNTDVAALNNGSAYYVRAPGDPMAETLLRYDHLDPVEGLARSLQGQDVAIQGRYSRDERRIEVLVGNELRGLHGVEFPTVSLGERYYAFVQAPNTSKLMGFYAQVGARSQNSAYVLVKTYQVKPSSNVPPDRGFVTPEAAPASLDSSMYLVGLQPFAVKLPRRAKQLVGELEECEVLALKRCGKYRWKDAAYVEQLINAMEEECRGD